MACSRNSPRSAIPSNSSRFMNLYSRPSISLPRLGRVVADTDSAMFWSSSISLRAKVDLPAPLGLDSANMRPRRATFSFNIGGLLLDLVDHGLQVEADARELQVCGFGAQRIGLAGQLLAQEIEPASGRFRLRQQNTQFHRMRGEPIDLLLHVGLGRHDRGLLRHPRRIELDLRGQR